MVMIMRNLFSATIVTILFARRGDRAETSHCLEAVVVVCVLVSPRDRCHRQTPLLGRVIVSKSQE